MGPLIYIAELQGQGLHYITQTYIYIYSLLYGWVMWTYFTPYSPGTHLARIMVGLRGSILHYLTQAHMEPLVWLGYILHITLYKLNTYRACCIARPHGHTLPYITLTLI